MTKPGDTKKAIGQFARGQLAKLLSQCTNRQQAMFARAYPTPISEMSMDKVASATDLCERTLRKNEEGRNNGNGNQDQNY